MRMNCLNNLNNCQVVSLPKSLLFANVSTFSLLFPVFCPFFSGCESPDFFKKKSLSEPWLRGLQFPLSSSFFFQNLSEFMKCSSLEMRLSLVGTWVRIPPTPFCQPVSLTGCRFFYCGTREAFSFETNCHCMQFISIVAGKYFCNSAYSDCELLMKPLEKSSLTVYRIFIKNDAGIQICFRHHHIRSCCILCVSPDHMKKLV